MAVDAGGERVETAGKERVSEGAERPRMNPAPPRQPIAFVGWRGYAELPRDLRDLFEATARWVAGTGRTLHTGAAEGADQAAAVTALRQGGAVHLFRPDQRSHEKWCQEMRACFQNQVRFTIYDPRHHAEWMASVDRYHPNPGALRPSARLLMARNFGLVQGCGAVVALPRGREPAEWGGTGQALRIALARGMPLYNLWEPEARAVLERRLAAAAAVTAAREAAAEAGRERLAASVPDLLPPAGSWPEHSCRPGRRNWHRIGIAACCRWCGWWWKWEDGVWCRREDWRRAPAEDFAEDGG